MAPVLALRTNQLYLYRLLPQASMLRDAMRDGGPTLTNHLDLLISDPTIDCLYPTLPIIQTGLYNSSPTPDLTSLKILSLFKPQFTIVILVIIDIFHFPHIIPLKKLFSSLG